MVFDTEIEWGPFARIRARVFIKFEGSLSDLAGALSFGLAVPQFEVAQGAKPDAKAFGLGFDLSLSRSDMIAGYPFSLDVESEASDESLRSVQSLGLSPWFARLVSQVSASETCVVTGNAVMAFKDGSLLEKDQVAVSQHLELEWGDTRLRDAT